MFFGPAFAEALKADIDAGLADIKAGRVKDFDASEVVLKGRARYAKFIARLDAPPDPNARLRRTMTTPYPWE